MKRIKFSAENLGNGSKHRILETWCARKGKLIGPAKHSSRAVVSDGGMDVTSVQRILRWKYCILWYQAGMGSTPFPGFLTPL